MSDEDEEVPEYRCSACGDAQDFGIARPDEDSDGVPILTTPCCGALYMRPNGTVVYDDPRADEEC